MSKKIVLLVTTGLLFISTSSDAVTRSSFGSKNGFYIGGNLGSSKVTYSSGSSTNSSNSMPVEVIFGGRYYVGDVGVGIKGSVTTEKYSNTVGNTTSSADGLRKSVEAQAYYDLFNFQTNYTINTMGITIGSGYEDIDYTKVVSKTLGTSVSYKNYSDSSIFYTAAVHFRKGINRVEVGYKVVNYKEKTVSEGANGSVNPDKVGFRLSDTFFINYSLSF